MLRFGKVTQSSDGSAWAEELRHVPSCVITS